jgi:hypothetical protein
MTSRVRIAWALHPFRVCVAGFLGFLWIAVAVLVTRSVVEQAGSLYADRGFVLLLPALLSLAPPVLGLCTVLLSFANSRASIYAGIILIALLLTAHVFQTVVALTTGRFALLRASWMGLLLAGGILTLHIILLVMLFVESREPARSG